MEIARYLFYHTMKPLVRFVMWILLNFSIKTNPLSKVKGSYLIIGHHVSEYDAVFVNIASSKLVRFLVGDANMDTSWKRWLFNLLGMVPFRKKKSDMKSIRALMRLTKQDNPIGLYPEGGRNWDGATDTLIPSTAKLIKMMGIPVYVTLYKGGFLTRPRWASHFRRGQIDFEGKMLLETQDIRRMTVNEIALTVSDALDYNEFDWQKEHMIPFKGKNRAEHIERLLYKCPACGEIGTMASSGHEFYCKKCRIMYHMNVYGFIEGCDQFDDTVKWNRWQKSFIEEIAMSMDSYEIKDIAFEKLDINTKEKTSIRCDLRIHKDLIEINEEKLSINNTFGFSCTLMDILEFFTTTHKYRLVFEPTRHLSIVFIYDLLNQLKENSKNEQ